MSPLASPVSLRAAPAHCSLVAPPRSRRTTSSPSAERRTAVVAASSPSSSSSSSESRLPGAPGSRTAEAATERQQLFNDIAPVYDVLNDALSLGLHRVWKRMAVRWSGARAGDRALDLCCGSGDVARLLAARAGPAGGVVGLDFAREMLLDADRRSGSRGRRRKAKHDDDDDEHSSSGGEGEGRGEEGSSSGECLCSSPPTATSSEVDWVLGDATRLPFADASFDAATLAYGLRNVSDPLLALREARRVLKPGSKIAVLDFNHSESAAVDAAQAAALAGAVVPAARALGVGPQYEYLRPSILAYPTGKELVALAREAGFDGEVRFHEIALGLMGCLVAGTKRR